MIRILHTADVHLGAKFGFLGTKAGEYRKKLVDSFEKLPELAKSNKADLVVVCGDLFDSRFPSKLHVDIVKNVFSKLAAQGIYVAVIPGNHDYLDETSVYKLEDLSGGNDKVIIFNDPKKIKHAIDELKLNLYAKPTITNKSNQSPIPKLETKSGDPLPGEGASKASDYLNVALVHGSMDMGKSSQGSHPFTKAEIEKSGFDYVALGDWHGFLDCSAGEVKAAYPGSLEPLAIDQSNAGNVIIVKIDGRKTTLERVEIGSTQVHNISINVADSDNILAKIEQELDSRTNDLKNTIVTIQLEGTKKLGSKLDIVGLTDYFSSKVFFVKILDKTKLEMGEKALKNFPEYSIERKFIDYINSSKADEELKKKALERGLGLLGI